MLGLQPARTLVQVSGVSDFSNPNADVMNSGQEKLLQLVMGPTWRRRLDLCLPALLREARGQAVRHRAAHRVAGVFPQLASQIGVLS